MSEHVEIVQVIAEDKAVGPWKEAWRSFKKNL